MAPCAGSAVVFTSTEPSTGEQSGLSAYPKSSVTFFPDATNRVNSSFCTPSSRHASSFASSNHADVGQTLNNLALVYRAQAKYTESEGLFLSPGAPQERPWM